VTDRSNRAIVKNAVESQACAVCDIIISGECRGYQPIPCDQPDLKNRASTGGPKRVVANFRLAYGLLASRRGGRSTRFGLSLDRAKHTSSPPKRLRKRGPPSVCTGGGLRGAG